MGADPRLSALPCRLMDRACGGALCDLLSHVFSHLGIP